MEAVDGSTGQRLRDKGHRFGIRDSGTRDSGFGIRNSRFGILQAGNAISKGKAQKSKSKFSKQVWLRGKIVASERLPIKDEPRPTMREAP